MNPPPAEGFASRLFIGPALRTQPDRRLVTLVRDGYESAFEEIVRRYGKPLSRYAAAIVGGRSEDVTQDAFSKALLALRSVDGAEIELRPWLYRIVRNTALNDLRDRPPAAAELAETMEGGRSASEEVERREEVAELMRRLRALPEPQRAAIVMRELEGLSHEEIATALGLSGGGARQAIYRARQALRDGVGLMIPLPLLRMLIDHGAEAGVAGAGASGAAVAAGAASAGGAGMGGALKLGLATALVAGTVGTGVALNHHHSARGSGDGGAVESAASSTTDGGGSTGTPPPGPVTGAVGLGSGVSAGRSGSEDGGGTDRHGRGSGSGRGEVGEADDNGSQGSSGAPPGSGQHGGPGSGDNGQGHGGGGKPGGGEGGPPPGQGSHSGPGGGGDGSGGGPGTSGGQGSGGGQAPSGGQDGGGSGGSGGGHQGSGGGGGSGSGEGAPPPPPPPPGEQSGSGSGSPHGQGSDSSGGSPEGDLWLPPAS